MMATGSGPWRLARPVLYFGLIVGGMMAVLAHLLVPAALGELHVRENEITRDVTARILTEGTFLHPSPGVTLYTREIDDEGVLRDVFLSDRRDPESFVIYTAADAYLVREGGQTSLIMVDGLAQRLGTDANRLATATFKDFSYDISALVRTVEDHTRQVRSMLTTELMGDLAEIAARGNYALGMVAEELHSRLAAPVFAVIAALVGFAVLISGGYSRFGAWREILIAFAALLLLDGLRATITDPIRETAALWPLAYLPAVSGALLVLILLSLAARPFRRRRKAVA